MTDELEVVWLLLFFENSFQVEDIQQVVIRSMEDVIDYFHSNCQKREAIFSWKLSSWRLQMLFISTFLSLRFSIYRRSVVLLLSILYSQQKNKKLSFWKSSIIYNQFELQNMVLSHTHLLCFYRENVHEVSLAGLG